MAISIFGVVFGLIMFFIDKHIDEVKKANTKVSSGDEEEDFFND